jgi:hypothetical protein
VTVTPTPTTTPPPVAITDVVLFAWKGGSLIVGDRREVLGPNSQGYGTIVNAGSGATQVGTPSNVGNIWSVGQVTLNDRSRVHGFVKTSAATITKVGSASIDDTANTVTGLSPLPLDAVLAPLNFTVTYPTSTRDVIINADSGTVTLAPGSYGTVSVGDRSTLRLSAGFYYFNSFTTTAQAVLGIDTSASPGVIEIYVRTSFQFQSREQLFGGSLSNLRIIYTGTQNIALDISPSNSPSFTGIVLALDAQLGMQQELAYYGSFYAKSLNLQPATNVIHVPWNGQLLSPQVTYPLTLKAVAPTKSIATSARRSLRHFATAPRAATGGGNHFDVTVAVPSDLDFREVAVLTDGGALTLDAAAQVLGVITGFATIVNVSSTPTNLAAGLTNVGNVWSVGDVTIGAGAHVHGFVRTSGTLTAPPGSIIDIPSTPVPSIPLGTALSLSIDFPDTNEGDRTVSSEVTVLLPGAYASVTVSGGALELGTGTYHFESLSVGAGGSVQIRASHGPVEIFVRDTLSFDGSLSFLAGNPSQLRIVYLGTTTLTLTGPFLGTVIAARAALELHPGSGPGDQTFVGTFIGQSVHLFGGVTVRQQTFFEPPIPIVDQYVYGFSGPVGAGPYPRTLPAPESGNDVDNFFGGGAIENLPGQALGDLKPVVTIGSDGTDTGSRDSLTYQLRIVNSSPITNTTIQAVDQTRPYVQILGDTNGEATLTPTTDTASPHRFEVDGLWLGSKEDTVNDFLVTVSGSADSGFDWDEIVIRHTTFDPGGHRADGSRIATLTLAVTGHVRRLVIARSILGPIDVRSVDGGSVDEIVIVDSIIDATATTSQVAIHNPAGLVVMRGVTVLGDVRVERLEATDSLVMGRLVVANTQDSCFRFSAASRGPDPRDPLPKQYHSFTDDPIEPFFFTSLRFGDPGYAQLSRLAPQHILRGAENSSEMGAFSFMLNPIRLASVLAKVDEFGPVGMLAQYIYEGESATGLEG